jgi:hypothetical protein
LLPGHARGEPASQLHAVLATGSPGKLGGSGIWPPGALIASLLPKFAIVEGARVLAVSVAPFGWNFLRRSATSADPRDRADLPARLEGDARWLKEL